MADFTEAYPIVTQFSATIENVDGRADLAAIHGSFDSTLEMEEGETRMVGKWLATYRKEWGRWRIATNCWREEARKDEEDERRDRCVGVRRLSSIGQR